MTFLHLNIWKAQCDSDNQTDKAAACIHGHTHKYRRLKHHFNSEKLNRVSPHVGLEDRKGSHVHFEDAF